MKRFFCLLIISFFSLSNAHALLITGPDIIDAPATILDDTTTNDHQQGFNEAQDVWLPYDLAVDGGFIEAGTTVDSHMIFLNTEGGTFATDTQDWFFDGLVIGVMSNYNGSLEVASSDLLGAAGTVYPNSPFSARGMEGNDGYIALDNSIRVRMSVTEPGDWIRVITQVPEPASIFVLLSGLLALGWLRKKA